MALDWETNILLTSKLRQAFVNTTANFPWAKAKPYLILFQKKYFHGEKDEKVFSIKLVADNNIFLYYASIT